MVKEGLFEDVDFALSWHPMDNNSIMSVNSLANFQVYYKFKGKSSHAAATPHLGRSALDAVELMNIGVNYLREHIIQEARVHYAITNAGGFSPNVVQPNAEVLYLVRAPEISQVQEIYERVCNIAKGAAIMTGTEVEIVFDKACSNVIPNKVLETVMYRSFQELGIPEHDEEELQLAKKFILPYLNRKETEPKNQYRMLKMRLYQDGWILMRALYHCMVLRMLGMLVGSLLLFNAQQLALYSIHLRIAGSG